MRGNHAQSRQSTATTYSRPGPDFRATHIKSSGQRAVNLHLFGPVADEIGLSANSKLDPQLIGAGIVGGTGRIVAPGIQILHTQRLVEGVRPAHRAAEQGYSN